MVQDGSYHAYQQILDFQTPNAVLKQRRARKKFKKSIDGCMCCKKRRKKCDETKPVCKGCSRNGLNCEWPKHVNVAKAVDVNDVVVNGDHQNDGKKDHEFLLLDQFLTIQLENKNFGSPPSSTESFDFEFSDIPQLSEINMMKSTPKPQQQPLETENYIIPGIQLSYQDQLCYNQFIKKFIPSITACHNDTDPSTSPYQIFTPFATNTLVREIFLACGATLLCFNNDSYHQLAHDKYVRSVNLLIQNLRNSSRGCEDYLFVSVQILQTLCLRDKNIGLNATKSASHLSAAYEILKKRKISQSQGPSVLDRILTEHFVFNYPITIMLCHHNKLSTNQVPSPFEIFNEFDEFLTKPIINNDPQDIWTNHPMLGMSLKALELSAKCTWICRLLKHPISSQELKKSETLKTQVYKELDHLNFIKTEDKEKLVNISFAKSILHGCLIITKKICDWSISLQSLQPEVESIISEFKFCYSLYEPHHVLLSIWCLFVCGSASTTVQQREFLTFGFLSMASKIHSSLIMKILKYLKIIWDEEADNNNNLHGESSSTDVSTEGKNRHVGFEFLFDTTVLDIVCS